MKHVEDAIQASIVDYLRTVLHSRDYRVCAIPNGGRRGKVEVARMKATGTLAGMPDLMIFGPGGRCWFVEVKAGDGRLSPAQDDIRLWMAAKCVPHIVARSIDDVRMALQYWGLATREAVQQLEAIP